MVVDGLDEIKSGEDGIKGLMVCQDDLNAPAGLSFEEVPLRGWSKTVRDKTNSGQVGAVEDSGDRLGVEIRCAIPFERSVGSTTAG